MFEKNIHDLQPGMGQQRSKTARPFTDVRELQRQLKAQVYSLQNEADETTDRTRKFIAIDPDGNPILLDQHV